VRPACFTRASAWEIIAPAGVEVQAGTFLADHGMAWPFRLAREPSFFVTRLNYATNLPENFRMAFSLSGTSQPNNLEFKLTDIHGNSFRKVWRDTVLTAAPRRYHVDCRMLRYAWGPHPEIKLDEITGVEWALSGKGGSGILRINDFVIQPLEPRPGLPAMKARASSERSAGEKAFRAADDNPATQWRSDSRDAEWLELIFEEPQTLAGLNIYWAFAGDYDVQVTTNKTDWQTIYHQVNSLGGLDRIYFRPVTVHGLRIQGRKQATREGYAIREIEFRYPDEAVALSSSHTTNSTAEQAMDGNQQTAWRHPNNNPAWLQVDLKGRKAWGGLVIHWGDDYASDYDVEISSNGINWSPVHQARGEPPGTHEIYLEEIEARFLRIRCRRSGTGNGYTIREIELRAPDEVMTPTRYFQVAASRLPGGYPRWLLNEQAYWTLAGSPEDTREAALCEDGTLEPHKRGFTLMPLLETDRLITRNDAAVTCSLLEECLPIPSVHWKYNDLQMDVQLTVTPGTQSVALTRYRLSNTGGQHMTGALALVIHPIQVYPPWQHGTDGFAPIRHLSYSNGTATINQTQDVHFLTAPTGFAARAGHYGAGQTVRGDIVDDLAADTLPETVSAEDPDGFASGCARFPFVLEPGQTHDIYLAVPLHEGPSAGPPGVAFSSPAAFYETTLATNRAYWAERVNRMDISIPDNDLLDALKANIAYNLITKDGVGFQPGSRSYDKAWMRDGGVAAIALLKVGLREEIRDFLAWMASYQFENGEIPPIIDNKADDPLWEEKREDLHEFDSQGEFIHTLLSYYYFTGDRAFLEQMYPRVIKALKFLQHLREQRAGPEYRDDPEKRVYYNILPPSRSHEGYFLAHSYWDDFWALAGWKDGAAIARILDDPERIPWMEEQYDLLRKGVYESIQAVMERDGIDYIPGCAEKGDYDATSTAAALVFCDELTNMPQPETSNTFRRFYRELRERMAPDAEYVYTPYEIRNVLALLKLGWKKEALELLDFLLAARRPPAWQHLAEVVHSDPRFPCYIGDMPHTWVGAGVINSIRGLFVYETGRQLILGAGIKPEWLADGVSVEQLPTWFGPVSFRMQGDARKVDVDVSGTEPPDGITVKNPRGEPVTGCMVNGELCKPEKGDVHLTHLPAHIEFVYDGPAAGTD
jgi:hypothetical protein